MILKVSSNLNDSMILFYDSMNTNPLLRRTDGLLLKIRGTSYGTVSAALGLILGAQLKHKLQRSCECIKSQL